MCSLVRALAQIDCRNEYFIFTKASAQNILKDLPAVNGNFHFVPLPNLARPARLLWQHFGAGFHSRRYGIEVWHGLHYSLPYFTGAMRTVSTFHDAAFFLYPHLYPAIKRIYFQQAIRHALAKADAIISVSQSTASDLRRLKVNFDARKLRVVHSGVDSKFFFGVPTEEIDRVRRRYALATPYILFLGTFEKRKNLSLLIEAFSRLRHRGHGDLQLVLAGQRDNARAEIEKKIFAKNLNGAVRCLGYMPDDEILPLYQGASLFALPSLHEGFGFPLLEAMAGGVPVLAADNSAMRELAAVPEMLCAGDAEIWAQRMERVLFDNDFRQQLIVRGRQRAQEFSWLETAAATMQIYESLKPSPAPAHLKPAFECAATALLPIPHNGVAPGVKIISSNGEGNGFANVDEAVLTTLAYADLFDYPLRAAEVHDGLLACSASFPQVQMALEDWTARGLVEQRGRFFFIHGREKIVEVRRQRRQQTRQLLQRHSWLLRLLIRFPFVRSVSLSGAVAFENSHRHDDIDLFVLTAGRRLWSVYLALVMLLKLLGKRKTICLNCLLDLDHLRIDDRDFFVAHQIAFLKPLSGSKYFQMFQATNTWIGAHLPNRNAGSLSTQHSEWLTGNERSENFWLKKVAEKIWSWTVFDSIEKFIFRLYHRRIRLLTSHLGPDSIIAKPGQIKLFTNNHRPRVINALQQRLQEILRAIQPAQAKLKPENVSGYSNVPIPADNSIKTAQKLLGDTTVKAFARSLN